MIVVSGAEVMPGDGVNSPVGDETLVFSDVIDAVGSGTNSMDVGLIFEVGLGAFPAAANV